MKLTTTMLALLLLNITFGVAQEKTEWMLFYLGGQSNMDGYGYVKDLPKSLNTTFEDVYIFHGNTVADGTEQGGGVGEWKPLQQGHGVGFEVKNGKNKYSDRFGVELTFAATLKEKYPNKKIAIIKYSRGGTAIDTLAAGTAGCWEPDFRAKNGLNQYDYFLKTVQNAMQVHDIDNDGKEDVLVPKGILWMQGESDASFTEEIALRYYDHLKRLMDLMRATFYTDDLPVIIGKISDSWNNEVGKVWKHGELIQYAEEKYAREDAAAAIVRSTRYYKYSDPWHYDSAGYIDFGKQFALALIPFLK